MIEPAPAAPLVPASGSALAASSAAAVAGELVAHVVAELPALQVLEDRDRLLAAAWSPRTRRSYAGDIRSWRAWTRDRGIELLAAGRVHVDLWVRTQLASGAGDTTVRRRLSGVGSFYRYCLSYDLLGADPVAGVARPRVDPDNTAPSG